MYQETTYRAAQAVAEVTAEHFAQHIAAAQLRGEQNLAPDPYAQTIARIIDVTFWASLRREEGHSPKISLAFLPPSASSQPLLFEQKLPLNPHILTKLAPAVERPGIHLGIWFEAGELHVWGTTRDIPPYCFVLEVIEPGLLVIKHRRQDNYGKFINVAVLKGDQVKVVDETSATISDCPALLTSLLGFISPSSQHDTVDVLVQLATSMRAHGRGGSLLVVPAQNQEWRKSIVHPILYSVAPAFSELTHLAQQDVNEADRNRWLAILQRAVDNVAGLTAVDGATIISDQYELLAFGAKITRADGNAQVEKMILTEPVKGGGAVVVSPAQSGGTRHLSAAQFVHDQRDALALVASQDGRFTIFTWSSCEEMVHAHRVDALLL